MQSKIIAMYLPQFHRTKENDKWWGDGYTDWVAVQRSKPLYKGHQQPRVPLDNHYYDLSNKEEIKKQADLAKKYGVYGFGIYHYWFSSNQVLLDKPALLIRENRNIDINYFFMWDNGSWKRTWSNVKFSNSWAPLYDKENKGPEILAELVYGDEKEWKKHFDYLLPFFKDDRYIKVNDKPLFGIFNQNNNSDTLKKIFSFWNKCAIKEGFSGICILGKTNVEKVNISDYQFDYEPSTHGWNGKNWIEKFIHRTNTTFKDKFNFLKTYDYSSIYESILKDVNGKDERLLPGAFVRYDDSPRRGKKGIIVKNESSNLFQSYMTQLLMKSEKYNKPFIFLTAWNEWGEGAYLEPDLKEGYSYLNALKEAIESAEKNV